MTFKSLAAAVLVVAAAALPSAQSNFLAPTDMQTVHVVLLMTGPNSGAGTKAEQDQMQSAHIAHLTKLGAEGHAYIAGPIDGGKNLRGILLMKAATADAARALEAEDPAVKAGRLTIDVVSYSAPGNWFSFAPIPTKIEMRQYVFGYLKSVTPAPALTADARAKALEGHLANLWALREGGALVSAGPAQNGGDRAGVVIFALDSIEKAKAWLDQDPAVKAGLFTPELYAWYAADKILKGK